MNPRVGVIFTPDFAPEALRDFVQRADQLGLDEVLLFEDCFRESGLVPATAALAWTHRIHVSVGVLPMPLRNVALLAMEVASIERMFPGRFRVGVGHGLQEWMQQVGNRHASPLTLMREYVPALRALLAGEKLTTTGRYVNLDAVELYWKPENPVPVWAAGEGPKTIALTGEVADGTILTSGTSPSMVADAVASVSAARAAAGRGPEHRVSVFLMTGFGADGRAHLDRTLAAWNYTGERAFGAAGEAAEVAATVRELVDAGADTVLLSPLDGSIDLEAFLVDAAKVADLVR